MGADGPKRTTSWRNQMQALHGIRDHQRIISYSLPPGHAVARQGEDDSHGTNSCRENAMTMKFIVALGLILGIALPAAGPKAAEELPHPVEGHFDLWVSAVSWPALETLTPAAGGSFDKAGFGIGGSFHWPMRRFGNSDLLVGLDGFVQGNDSNVEAVYDDLMARNLYIGASLKWLMGRSRSVSLDAGLGLNFMDIADVNNEYFYLHEQKIWESTAPGGFIGASWDVGRKDPLKQFGLFLSLRAHYADFGTVRDEEAWLPVFLGPDAGKIDGPVYMMLIGLSGR